jgi:predicted metalloenzyme YecM
MLELAYPKLKLLDQPQRCLQWVNLILPAQAKTTRSDAVHLLPQVQVQ